MTAVRDEVSTATPAMGDDGSHQAAQLGAAIAAVESVGDVGGGTDESMVSVPLYRSRRGHGVGLASAEPAPEPPPKPTVLARTLALAHRLQRMLDAGRARNRADLAAKLGFSRARVTQIMNLLWLAPDIQEEILFSVSPTGRDVVTTRDVRAIVRVMDWGEQRKLWRAIREAKTTR
jgi:hypothetical protein